MKSPRRSHVPRGRKAFSLVEVALALGVVAFGLTATLGLLPVGLSTFREAIKMSVQSQIVERITAEAMQSDFTALTGSGIREHPVEFFDEQGEKVATAGEAIYHVKVVARDGAAIPGGTATGLARLTIDIVANPSNRTVKQDPLTLGFLHQPEIGISVSRHAAWVARR